MELRSPITTPMINKPHISKFEVDADSFHIGFDIHASYSTSNDKRHFIGNLKPLNQVAVIGVNETLFFTHTRTRLGGMESQ